VGSLVAAVASSHAFAVMPPEKWDELRERNRNVYAQRQQIAVPAPHPRMNAESMEDVQTRYAHVRNGLFELKRIIEESKPDALLVIGDDQNENFTAQNVPQFAIYTGAEAVFFDRLLKEERTYRCDAEIAHVILDSAVEGSFDLSFSENFPDKRLISHAHVEPLMRILLPNADLPIVPIYVNAIHPPSPTPSARCLDMLSITASLRSASPFMHPAGYLTLLRVTRGDIIEGPSVMAASAKTSTAKFSNGLQTDSQVSSPDFHQQSFWTTARSSLGAGLFWQARSAQCVPGYLRTSRSIGVSWAWP
jgi:hypothetical protein